MNILSFAHLAAAPAGGGLVAFLPMIAMIAVLYFLMIRPQQKKQKAINNMLANLKVGDRVKSIGGIYGRITGIKDNTIIMEVGPGKVELVFERSAIASVEDSPVENEMKA